MSHRAQQVVDAVVAAISAQVVDSGVKVFAHRGLSLASHQDELPAISVDFGDDETDLDADEGDSTLLSKLTIRCVALVALPEEHDVRVELLSLCRSIHVAIMTDRSLGLAFFAMAYRAGESDHEVEAGTEVIVGSRTSNWLIHYFMNIADPGD